MSDQPSLFDVATPDASEDTDAPDTPAAASEAPPPDDDVRTRIRTELGTTLFVEAGAGAGKTTALVDRVVNLVLDAIPITGIAAITFTEKAAAELRSRVRERLGERSEPAAVRALADLDHAPIGTLHAFARRILNDVPIEAGLPPGFGVLDELESNMRFDEEWSELLDRLLAEPRPAGGPSAGGRLLVDLCQFDNFGIDKDLRRIASDFRSNWDLVADRVDDAEPPPFDLDVQPVTTMCADVASTPTPPGDTQETLLADVADIGRALESTGELTTQLELLGALTKRIGKARSGNKQKWKELGTDALDDLREREGELAALADRAVQRTVAYRKRLAGVICRRFVLGAAADRVSAGTLDFHDLLVHARRLLTVDARVRRELHDRYPRILLDEFQDTDPIQLEIAVRLTADPDAPAQAGDWLDLRPIDGRLFIVGDPKQSIYRFRRADIAQYLRAADQVGADTVKLTANFRSTDAVIEATNRIFSEVIVEEADTQPAFQHLDACRREPLRAHGTVHVLGTDHHEDLADKSWEGEHGPADELRRREACDVAGAVSAALREGWPVADADTGELRPCRPGDICILVPTRISLPALETELRGIGVPTRAENASLVYAAPEIRDLLLALRAADDPTDELALVASLRSTLYGCSDVELWQWRDAGGRWGIWQQPPDGMHDHPVADAIAHLRSLHDRTSTVGAAELLAAMADECRVFDVGLAGPDDRDVWRRLRFVIDQARSWADAGGRGVRRYLAWARLQASDGRVSETILPELDHDAVRIMTVHAAKGLQFPITVVSGMTTKPMRRSGTQVVWDGSTWHLTGRGDDGSFDDVRPIDELMSDAERRRLLYVACTRAADHLVVSLHRSIGDEKASERDIDKLTSAELLWRCGALDTSAIVRRLPPIPVDPAPPRSPSAALMEHADWRAELNEVTERASRRSAIAATRLADEVRLLRERDLDDDAGLDKHPVNIDLPPWQRGRYGTAIGRAVHGTLQFCDLSSGTDIDDLARSQCSAEGIIGFDTRVAALARSALAAPIVRSAASGAEHWRELFIAAPVGNRVLEGYIDLLVRTPDGLVIVDYKTDRWSGPVQTEERVGRYRTQLASYGAALESALDEPVVGGILVRCDADRPADQIPIDDWAAALDEVRTLVG